MRLFRVLAYFFMLFLAFLHKMTPNCKVRDYKKRPEGSLSSGRVACFLQIIELILQPSRVDVLPHGRYFFICSRPSYFTHPAEC